MLAKFLAKYNIFAAGVLINDMEVAFYCRIAVVGGRVKSHAVSPLQKYGDFQEFLGYFAIIKKKV
jgi:hypothetical protein